MKIANSLPDQIIKHVELYRFQYHENHEGGSGFAKYRVTESGGADLKGSNTQVAVPNIFLALYGPQSIQERRWNIFRPPDQFLRVSTNWATHGFGAILAYTPYRLKWSKITSSQNGRR